MKDPKDCTCMCHRDPSIRHFVPCCGPFAITKEWVKRMAHLEGDSEIRAGVPDHMEDMRAMVARAEAAEARVKVLEEALRWALPQATAHRPGCSLYDDVTCDCGDWNDKWTAARAALGAEHGK